MTAGTLTWVTESPKLAIIRDRRYLDWIRERPDLLDGEAGTPWDPVEPAHIGTLGKGIKSSDDEVIPLRHSRHSRGHNEGEMTVWRALMPDWLFRAVLLAAEYEGPPLTRQTIPVVMLRESLRTWARGQYRIWLVKGYNHMELPW